MARILIIAEHWPQTAGSAALLPEAIRGSGSDVAVICNERYPAELPENIEPVRVPFEPRRVGGMLFSLRNALFFGNAANPGNYAMLRDTLHLHLQEVLYDAIVILCPPDLYLKLAYWIQLSFGIPVWLHISAPAQDENRSVFHRWNHARLRRKYLAAATLVTLENGVVSDTVAVQEYQRKLLARPRHDGIDFLDLASGEKFGTGEVLKLIVGRKPQH